jgi:hypothetical protein
MKYLTAGTFVVTLVMLGEVSVAGRLMGKFLPSSSWRKRWPNPGRFRELNFPARHLAKIA